MFKKKIICRVLNKAKARFDGIQAIEASLDLGTGLSAKGYQQKISFLQQKISAYNQTLSSVDELRSQIDAAEKDLADFSEQILLGVAARYGKNSYEYEKAGGVRKSERKRPRRQTAVTA